MSTDRNTTSVEPWDWRPRTRLLVRPPYLLAMGALLSIFIFASSFYEQERDRTAILSVMEQQARSLAEAVSKGAANAVLANEAIVSERIGRLEGISEHVIRMWRERRQSDAELALIARELQVDGITVYDREGAVLASSSTGVSIGSNSGHSTYGNAFEDGIVIVRDDPEEMVETRRRVGVGRLIRDVGTEAGVAFVVLQDRRGILAASEAVGLMSAFDADPFLMSVSESAAEATRVTTFENREVLESVVPFGRSDRGSVLRIGLWMQPVRDVESWGRGRLIWMSVGLAVGILVLANFLMLRQNYDSLTDAYKQIRTYTGDVLAHMADGVVVVDAEGRIVTFNHAAERIFEYSAEEVIGQSCRVIIADETPVLERTLETGEGMVDTECHYRTRRGKPLILNVSTSVLRDEAGDTESCIAVVKDLTQQRRVEEEMQRRERLAAMGDLAAGVAHEVRNPLNAIGMTMQRLSTEFVPTADEEEFRELVGLVDSETRRVNGIVDQFLSLARPPKLKKRPVRIDTLVRDLGQIVEAKAEESGLTLVVKADSPITVRVDPEQLSQAVLNLLVNAIEATPAGGRIDVLCNLCPDTPADCVAITVRDDGSGMDEQTRQRILTPYFTTKAEGTGLGLSTVERVVADHDGRLEIQSSPGSGSTFSILLPTDERETT